MSAPDNAATPTDQYAVDFVVPDAAPQHAWLRKLVGTWTYHSACAMAPGEEPGRATGTETVSMIGDLWLAAENHGAMPDSTPVHARMHIGFDPARDRYIGHWFCSIMPGHFVYEGTLDDDERVLTLDTTGPDFAAPDRTTQFQDIIELVDDDHRVLRSRMQHADGTWTEIMRADYRRTS